MLAISVLVGMLNSFRKERASPSRASALALASKRAELTVELSDIFHKPGQRMTWVLVKLLEKVYNSSTKLVD